jgi:hypothetical protein
MSCKNAHLSVSLFLPRGSGRVWRRVKGKGEEKRGWWEKGGEVECRFQMGRCV